MYVTKVIKFQTAPIGLKKLLVWIKNEYSNPPMFITENGFGDNGQLDDLDRISYLKVEFQYNK